MNARSYDAGELALSLLAELPEAERAALMVAQFERISCLKSLMAARRVLHQRTDELIAERFAETGARHG